MIADELSLKPTRNVAVPSFAKLSGRASPFVNWTPPAVNAVWTSDGVTWTVSLLS